ncbi:hypothetical protein [Psychrobacter sp.]|uniref:hypothetical protein n=1 Tax=unclassified Psychrobacter TaxID=196806 RepID=UPI003F99D1F3
MQNNVINACDAWALAFPTKFKHEEVATHEFIDLWSIALQLLNATDNEINTAIALSVTKKWPPSSPYDFIALVRGGGIADTANYYQVYEAAANGKYDHITAYVAAERFGFFEIVREDAVKASKRFKVIYEKVCHEYALNSANFEQRQLKIECKREIDKLALEKKTISLERQSAIATAALTKLGLK